MAAHCAFTHLYCPMVYPMFCTESRVLKTFRINASICRRIGKMLALSVLINPVVLLPEELFRGIILRLLRCMELVSTKATQPRNLLTLMAPLYRNYYIRTAYGTTTREQSQHRELSIAYHNSATPPLLKHSTTTRAPNERSAAHGTTTRAPNERSATT